ncbi:beta-lactamase domain protein [Mycobacterium kansasii 824]|nr:beta-lactamase domain protein [Mycobacterium kansasii 824]
MVTLAPGCAHSPTPTANAADPGRRIDTRTPPGLRAQQTVDMLNSDWPIGPVGVGTLATPGKSAPSSTPWQSCGGTARSPSRA